MNTAMLVGLGVFGLFIVAAFVYAQSEKTRVRGVEYGDQFIAILETMWGKGFLSPGGSRHIDMMVEGVDLYGKKVLDLGCGTGGPSFYLAEKFGAYVVGVDVEQNVLDKAQSATKKIGLEDRVSFELVSPEGALPFADDEFDVVFSKESILHIADKKKLFQEVYRVLKPGGVAIIFDWLHSGLDYSPAMEYFVAVDGLTMHLVTPSEYCDFLEGAGFGEIMLKNTLHITIQETKEDLHHLEDEKKDEIKSLFGEKQYQDYLKSWTLQLKVFENKEVQTYLIKAVK